MIPATYRGACARALVVAAVVVLAAGETFGHDGHEFGRWRLAPHLLAGLLLLGVVYAAGVRRLWRRAGVGAGISRGRVFVFGTGWTVLVLALVSPVDALAEALAAAHMVQHLALMLIAAPLMVLGASGTAALWALPDRWRPRIAGGWLRSHLARRGWAALSQPVLVWLVYFVVLWGWHVPSLYEAALAHRLLHDLQHVLFFGAAALAWWVVLGPMGGVRLAGGAGVLYLFTTSLHAMALGVFMTLSPSAWYETYVGTAPAWGLQALQDQQVAGAIMWMPAAVAYVLLAGFIFWLWMKQTEASATRLERIADHPESSDFGEMLTSERGDCR